MRIALLLVLALSTLPACGKKKAPQSPANAAPAGDKAMEEGKEEKSSATPDDKDDSGPKSDPCEGGQ
jgi:predicted small lipoprotein YifL